MSLKVWRRALVIFFIAASIVLAGIGLAHWRWVSYVETDSSVDVHEFFEMLFAHGKQKVSVQTGAVRSTGLFGAEIDNLVITALTPDAIILKVERMGVSLGFPPDGRTFHFSANGLGGPDSTVVGTVRFGAFDLDTDAFLGLDAASLETRKLTLSTLVPLVRHFTGDTALTKLLDWLTGELSGTIEHRIDGGSARLIGDNVSMKKLHALLPALSVDEFDLGIDYNPREIIFSKASRIHMVNAEFTFRGGLRALREAGRPLWDLKVELKAIPLVHALAAPVLGCPAEPVSWRTLAGAVSTKEYALSGSLLAPVCEVF